MTDKEKISHLICPHCNNVINTDTYKNPIRCPECKKLFVINFTEKDYIYYSVGIIAKLAKSDGKVSKNEAKIIGKILREYFKLNGENLEFAKQSFKELKSSSYYSIYDLADILYSIIRNQTFFISFYSILFYIAIIDGGLENREKEILQKILSHFHLNPDIFNKTWEKFKEEIFIEIYDNEAVILYNDYKFDANEGLYAENLNDLILNIINFLDKIILNGDESININIRSNNETYNIFKKHWKLKNCIRRIEWVTK